MVETRRGLAPSQKVGNLAVSSFFLIHPFPTHKGHLHVKLLVKEDGRPVFGRKYQS